MNEITRSRPQTISQAVARSDSWISFLHDADQFLDEFYADPKSERFEEAPNAKGAMLAFSAALTAELSKQNNWETPLWAAVELTRLESPLFPLDPITERYKAHLLAFSLPEFKARNLYFGEAVLKRA